MTEKTGLEVIPYDLSGNVSKVMKVCYGDEITDSAIGQQILKGSRPSSRMMYG